MTAAEEAKRLSTVSIRAQKLYARINSDWRFYPDNRKWNESKAMQELVSASLVQTAGRVNVIIGCFVPVRGFKPLQIETWTRVR